MKSVATGIALVLGLAAVAPTPAPGPRAPTTRADTGQGASFAARSRGRSDAPVTIYEMSDFQCPFCRRHALETLPVLEREYIATGKVRYVFVNFPIAELHPNAQAAAELGLCAARQRRFWPLHDLLFRTQPTWGPMPDPVPYLLTLADSAGLDHRQTLSCLADSTIRRSVEVEAAQSARTGATATPTFFIEGGLLIGAQPITVFRPILDSIIAVREK